jgi:SAM-dependent methyltransferase
MPTGTRVSDLERFEHFVLVEQRPTPPDHYDDGYFNEQWRANGNDYRMETRRAIEGEHPRLLKEVFAPRRVLDVGCGPGALMYLLFELGVDVDGVDYSPHCVDLAPEAVRARITVASIVDEPVFPDGSYDLVVCREVIEHLTVLQARKLLSNMCRISSRYVYVTTRFHPSPSGLLDVTDQRDVDPTHITLMNKDLLRLLFVLEGFHSRPDLENRIDWMKKDRALVYEKS